ncbi:hypothetical protein [Ensifer canadensis]
MKLKEAWKNMNWLRVAGIVTLAYAVAVCFMLGWVEIWSFLTTTKSDDLNRVGDFVAGMFAPVAVLWLTAAVLTQRQELQDSRDQFKTSQQEVAKSQQEAREQFAKSQEVIDAQLQTISRQNALAAEQHNLTVENAKKAYKLSLFDKRFAIYEKFVNLGKSYKGKDYDEAIVWAMMSLSQEASFVFDQSISAWFLDIASEMQEFLVFKREKQELEFVDGNILLSEDQLNEDVMLEKRARKDRIAAHFLTSNMSGKFWRYMDVSDQPLVAG